MDTIKTRWQSFPLWRKIITVIAVGFGAWLIIAGTITKIGNPFSPSSESDRRTARYLEKCREKKNMPKGACEGWRVEILPIIAVSDGEWTANNEKLLSEFSYRSLSCKNGLQAQKTKNRDDTIISLVCTDQDARKQGVEIMVVKGAKTAATEYADDKKSGRSVGWSADGKITSTGENSLDGSSHLISWFDFAKKKKMMEIWTASDKSQRMIKWDEAGNIVERFPPEE